MKKQRGMIRSLITGLTLGVCLLNATSIVHAQENSSSSSKPQEKTTIVETNKSKEVTKEKKKKVEVNVIYNSSNEDFIKDITFEDGTKVKDYDYTITYSKNITNIASIQAYSFQAPITQYFNYAAWITRDGVVSLSLDPNDSVRHDRSTKDAAWNIVSSPTYGFSGDSRWQNTQVMQWQYDCHFQFATNKDTWNLEPSRTASSYAGVVLSGCNP